MKKIIILGFILLFVRVSTNAQDTSLYQGQSDIYLWSGKVLKQITLWKIDSIRVQYVIDGNLSEVLTEDVHAIATNNYEINFDEQKHILKRMYDLIIKSSGDTLKGFVIKMMTGNKIEYIPAGGKSNKATEYKSCVINKVLNTTLPSVTEKNEHYSELAKKLYPSAKNTNMNKDLIITTNNDSILCTILNADITKIDYVVRRHGRDTRAIILKSDIKKDPVNPNVIQFEAYDSLTSATFQNSNADLRSYNFDLIITLAGDTIWCTIISENDNDIFYHVAIPDHESNIRISKNLVKEYFNNDKKTEYEEMVH